MGETSKHRWDEAEEAIKTLYKWRGNRRQLEILRDLLVDCRMRLSDFDKTCQQLADANARASELAQRLDEREARIKSQETVIVALNANVTLLKEIVLKSMIPRD